MVLQLAQPCSVEPLAVPWVPACFVAPADSQFWPGWIAANLYLSTFAHNVAVVYSNDFIRASQAGPYHDILICKGPQFFEASA